jgi:hypothetical protein
MKKGMKKAKKAATKKGAKKASARPAARVAKSAKKTKKAAKPKAAAPKKTAKKKKAAVAKSAPKKAVTKKRPVKKAALKKKKAPPAAPPPALPLGARAAAIPEPTITPDSPSEVLLALARLLHDDAQYHAGVRLAATDPQAYVTQFADDLSSRGIEEPQPNLPWIALTDGLSQRDALVQLDWKFEPADLYDALDTLLGSRRHQIDLAGLPGYDESTAGLQAVGDRLLDHGLALVTIDNNVVEDAFPVAILDADKVAEAQRLADAVGLGSIQRWSSDDEFQ